MAKKQLFEIGRFKTEVFAVCWVQRKGLIQVSERQVILSEIKIGGATVVPRIRTIGLQQNKLRKIFNGIGVLLESVIGVATVIEIIITGSARGIQRNRFGKIRNRLLIHLKGIVRITAVIKIVCCGRTRWINF